MKDLSQGRRENPVQLDESIGNTTSCDVFTESLKSEDCLAI